MATLDNEAVFKEMRITYFLSVHAEAPNQSCISFPSPNKVLQAIQISLR